MRCVLAVIIAAVSIAVLIESWAALELQAVLAIERAAGIAQ